jgi:hypothetical protein
MTQETIEPFVTHLERETGMDLTVHINENRSTMINLRREGRGKAFVSIHKMFLSAPQRILDALVQYIKGKSSVVKKEINSFIYEHYTRLDYSQELDHSKLLTKGQAYDLQEIYRFINKSYFGDKLNLNVTWYGRSNLRSRHHATFGLYIDPLRLVKIHRRLDHARVPHYVVAFVVYHEMLHHVCPAKVDENGRNKIHTEEFRRREQEFLYYEQAKAWVEDWKNWNVGNSRRRAS